MTQKEIGFQLWVCNILTENKKKMHRAVPREQTNYIHPISKAVFHAQSSHTRLARHYRSCANRVNMPQ